MAAPDPREAKILADILALVLDEQPGSAANALEALRNRAARDGVTGGALKNVFAALAAQSGHAERRERELNARLARAEEELRRDRQAIRALQAALARHQHESRMLMGEIAAQRAQRPWRTVALSFGIGAGLLLGVAATQLYHSLMDPPPVDRARYLR